MFSSKDLQDTKFNYMAELIAIIILTSSLLGMGVIILRKIPVLARLPETPRVSEGPWVKIQKACLFVGGGIKTLPGVRGFSYDIFLQKILSKIRVLTLKTEHKTGAWLEKLRQKSCQKNNHSSDNYWKEIKKTKEE